MNEGIAGNAKGGLLRLGVVRPDFESSSHPDMLRSLIAPFAEKAPGGLSDGMDRADETWATGLYPWFEGGRMSFEKG